VIDLEDSDPFAEVAAPKGQGVKAGSEQHQLVHTSPDVLDDKFFDEAGAGHEGPSPSSEPLERLWAEQPSVGAQLGGDLGNIESGVTKHGRNVHQAEADVVDEHSWWRIEHKVSGAIERRHHRCRIGQRRHVVGHIPQSRSTSRSCRDPPPVRTRDASRPTVAFQPAIEGVRSGRTGRDLRTPFAA
jgi:hypothetical protein